jgi:hypothetical protein
MKEAFLDALMMLCWFQFVLLVAFSFFNDIPHGAYLLGTACNGIGFVLLVRKVRKSIYA